ncbi:MAG: alanine racemase [Bacteroidota bacterium]
MNFIKTPRLVVDLIRVEENIKQMAEKVISAGLIFRPHFKTHQSHFIAKIFKKYGVDKCTVSSMGMANYFAADGWNDISVAFPANVNEYEEINTLAKQIKLQILVDSIEKIELLKKKIDSSLGIYIEVDTGYFRSGLMFNQINEIEALIDAILEVPQFSFLGFLSHTGNTYSQTSSAAIISLFEESKKKLIDLKKHFSNEFPEIILSMGDTPAASLASDFSGIDELRPGNFVFFDVSQYILGSCNLNSIAVAVYCPVVAKYPERNQVVIYGGGVHLSKEKTKMNGAEIFGFVAIPNQNDFGNTIENCYVISLSQEHGIIQLPDNYNLERIKLGDSLCILPIHSCMTVDLNSELYSIDGQIIKKYRTY